MMTPTAVYATLMANSALVALVGDRVYFQGTPDDPSQKYVSWQRLATQPFATHNEPTQEGFVLCQFSCFAATPEEADELCQAVITALDGVPLSTGDSPTLQTGPSDRGLEEVIDMYRSDADFLI